MLNSNLIRLREWSAYSFKIDAEELLNDYFQSDKPQALGLPPVTYFAEECHLSANYLGDLIKKETGKSVQEYIQDKIIKEAKNKIFDPDKNISEIAYESGFKYPQHFTRLFKQLLALHRLNIKI